MREDGEVRKGGVRKGGMRKGGVQKGGVQKGGVQKGGALAPPLRSGSRFWLPWLGSACPVQAEPPSQTILQGTLLDGAESPALVRPSVLLHRQLHADAVAQVA